MGLRDAEMTKYAANAMLATKISFMNEIALLCDQYGVDVENVRKGIGSDPRIGYSFIYPGSGYGGSCFPKDVRALISMAESVGVDPRIFRSVEERNRSQKTVLMASIEQHLGSDLTGKTFALWGLAFKPETDDVREAPALEMIQAIVDKGGHINAYDPQAMSTARAELADAQLSSINFMEDPYAAITGADALVIMTEWKMFRQPDFNLLSKLKKKIIFDGRNMYDPKHVANYGLTYVGIGRSSGLVPAQ
jgi:UDPglucose 6-dehydrogenase